MAQELLVKLDRKDGTSFHLQIERALRDSIRSGRLPAKTALPSTRVFAQDLGVSRGVVVEAYDQLIAEGYLVGRRGSATKVAHTTTSTAQKAVPSRAVKPLRYDFHLGVPNAASFPRSEWLTCMRQVLKDVPDSTFWYPDPQGALELREALCAYLGRVRGVMAIPEQMVICNGFAQGLMLVCAALYQRGARRVVVEDPTHGHHRAKVERAGLKPVGVPVDDSGLQTERLKNLHAGAAIVTPAHQYPTGAVLSPERRLELCAWAERVQGVVIEDDYDAEYRYDREPIGALQGLSPERVVYASSASKTLAPCFRLGWLVLPSWLAPDVAEAKRNDDLGSPAIEQLALAQFISSGRFDRHLRRNRVVYRRRRDRLVAALNKYLPQAEVQGVAAGLHLVVFFPEGVDETRLVEAAAELSVGAVPIASHRFMNQPGRPGILLGYGSISEAAIEQGIKVLRQAFDRTTA